MHDNLPPAPGVWEGAGTCRMVRVEPTTAPTVTPTPSGTGS
ncbi:hypothetical protein [Terrabacter sp. NPDC080008]